jgi:AbrB family looped-hinge helix DNA binding protein
MATTTIKMGKRGTLVLPAKLRKQFGLTDGSLLTTEVKDGQILIRPASLYEPEVWSNETRAYFLLINAMTKEEWDSYIPDVLAWGVDPARIEGLEPNHRETLPTKAEWDESVRQAVGAFGQEKMSA